MQTNSFILKVLLGFIAVVILFLLFLFIFFFNSIKEESLANQVRHLDTFSYLMEKELKTLWLQSGSRLLQNFVEEKAKQTGSQVTIVDKSGKVLADSIEDPSYMGNHAGKVEIMKALKGERNFFIRYNQTLKKNMLYFAVPVEFNNEIKGVLRTSLYMEDIEKLISSLQLNFLLVIFFLAFSSIISILIIFFNFKREIKRFSLIAEDVSQGKLEIEFSKTSSFEIKELSRSFSKMTSKIKVLITELEKGKAELERIISLIEEGIAVINEQGKFKLVNNSFLKIFKLARAENRYYWEVIRLPEVLELIKDVCAYRHFVQTEINQRIFICSRSLDLSSGEQVLVFSDITELENWENMKKELVANVSHELGTPLTSIKGYVETLLEEEKDPQKKKFLINIQKHAERLSLITKDLLLLSSLEEKTENELIQEVNLKKLIEQVAELFIDKIKSKGLKLTLDIEPGNYLFKGDAFKLEQAFINLLDNAYKYTEEGEITIKIGKEADKLIISFKDTGIGIPSNDLERIFERFYVVDKSRSRAQSGTGLGLSIVRYIVLLHGGDIQVKSTLGLGSEFRIIFPFS